MITLRHGDGPVVRGYKQEEMFSVIVSPRDTLVSSGGSGQVTYNDLIVNRDATAIVDHEFDVIVSAPIAINLSQPYLTNKTPSIISLNSNSATRLNDGVAMIDVTRAGGDTVKVTFNVSREGTTNDTFIGFTEGSLAKHIFDSIVSVVGSKIKDGGTNEMWFTAVDVPNLAFTRNPNHLLAAYDLTGISVAQGNPWTLDHRTATLVSPKHFITATHYRPQSRVAFLGSDSIVYTRTITSIVNISGTDISVGTLDSDLPAQVAWYKVLPANARSYLPNSYSLTNTNGYFKRLPVLEQRYSPSCLFANRILSTDLYTAAVLGNQDNIISDNLHASFSSWTESNNSSSSYPCFFLINGELVLLGTQHTTISNSSILDYRDDINAAMVGYQLTDVNLSSFPTYP